MFKIKISPISALIIASFILLFPTANTLVMIFAIIIHECGHIFAITAYHEKIDDITVTPFGLTINRTSKLTSYLQDMIIFLAGPFFNLLAFIATYRTPIDNLGFAYANISFCIVNLIPVRSLDGGRAIESILYTKISDTRVSKIMKILSFLTLFLLWIYSGAMLIYADEGWSMNLFCVWLFASLFLKKNNVKKSS